VSIGISDKRDEDPIYKNEKLCKSLKEDITIGIYINKNNRQYKPLPIDFEEVRGHIEMPRSLCPANAPPEVMIRSVWTSFNDLSDTKYTELIPVGGVVIFDIYKFSEQLPTEIKGWTVRQIFDKEKTLTSIPYPDPKCKLIL
jgi:hypothetical protein